MNDDIVPTRSDCLRHAARWLKNAESSPTVSGMEACAVVAQAYVALGEATR